jgi:hypothetical protein
MSRWIYWAIGAVVVVLAVIGLASYGEDRRDQEAQQKAQELSQKFERAGLPVPADQDIIVRSLGHDGGAVCDNAGDGLGKAILYGQLGNGASQVGWRPVIADRDVVRGQLLILQTYCPDELGDYEDILDDLKVDDTVEN